MNKEFIDILIQMLNESTAWREDLTFLGLSLAETHDIRALKILKVIIQSIQTNVLDNKISVNRPIIVPGYESCQYLDRHRENIASRLLENEHHLSRDVFYHIAKTEKVNFNFKPYGYDPILRDLVIIIKAINNPHSEFSGRRDLAKKNLEILEYFTRRGIIKIDDKVDGKFDIYSIFTYFKKYRASDHELNEIIERILNTLEQEKISYDELVTKNINELNWQSIKENSMIYAEDCSYMEKVIVPNLQRNRELYNRYG